MTALRIDQLKKLVEQIKLYVLGAQLQEIVLTETHLFLQHYAKGAVTLGVELKPLSPRLGYFFGEIPKRKALVKPIVLFLKAHARNHRLTDIVTDESLGRVVRLVYGGSQKCLIEIRLIPHGFNILIQTPEKSITLFPAKELPLSKSNFDGEEESFDVEAYLDDWMLNVLQPQKKGASSSPQEDQEKRRKKEIEKKKNLLIKLEDDLKAMNKPWQHLGDYLKIHQSLDVPKDWETLLDPQLPVNANMQRCFEKHKLQEKRQEQIRERILHVQKEVEDLENSTVGTSQDLQRPVRSLAGELLAKAQAKGRKLVLGEGIEAVFGKSARDNLALLRRAQAWDLWLHLRDLPGSHLIIRRPRNKSVDHHLMTEAARWLLRETIGKKKVIDGDRYDVIVTECRFVKPIKGDKLGRVNFQNEITLTLKV